MKQSIAALDLGTSKMIAMVAKKDSDGTLSILHTEKDKPDNSIRRGCVFNTDMVSKKVSLLIRKLKVQSNSSLEKIYVGIGGQSLRTELYCVKKETEGGIVSREIIDSLKDSLNSYQPDFEEILQAFEPEFYLDGLPEADPKGAKASVIEARSLLIVGNPSLKRMLEKVVQGKVASVDFFISPLATAEAVLTKEEKESGCALVEFGAGITYLSIYKDGFLKYMVSIPLGGNIVNKDICSLDDIREEEAEALKIKYGSALLSSDSKEKVKVNEKNVLSQEIEIKVLNTIIEARMDEIIANILTQIKMSTYEKSLGAGIVITGGAALLRNLAESIRNQSGKEVRLASAKTFENEIETIQNPANSCIIGLLMLGNENCLKEKAPEPPRIPRPTPTPTPPQPQPQPVPEPPKPITTTILKGGRRRWKNAFDDLTKKIFNDEDYDEDYDEEKNEENNKEKNEEKK